MSEFVPVDDDVESDVVFEDDFDEVSEDVFELVFEEVVDEFVSPVLEEVVLFETLELLSELFVDELEDELPLELFSDFELAFDFVSVTFPLPESVALSVSLFSCVTDAVLCAPLSAPHAQEQDAKNAANMSDKPMIPKNFFIFI